MTKRTQHIMSLGLFSLAAVTASNAATWDINADPGIQEGGGTWNTSNTFWTNDGGATRFAWNNTTNKFDTAVFGDAGGTGLPGGVTGTNGLQVGSIQINKNYNFSSWNITLNVGEISVASGVSSTIGNSLLGSVGMTKTGTGTLVVSSANGTGYTGGTFINAGKLNLSSNSNGDLTQAASGDIHLLNTNGTDNAHFAMEANNSNWTIPNKIVVRSGSSGNALITYAKSSGTGVGAFSGGMQLNKDLSVSKTNGNVIAMTFSGGIGGSGALTIDHSTGGGSITFSGDNSAHTGATTLRGNTVAGTPVSLNSTQGNSKLTLDKVSAGGAGILKYNIVNDVADQIMLLNAATLDLGALSLQPVITGPLSFSEYVLINTSTGVTNLPGLTIIDNYAGYDFGVGDGTGANTGKIVLSVSVVPEPGALSLLALVAPMVLRRRRA